MTLPLPEPSPAKKANWLVRYIGVQQAYDKNVLVALQQASVDALKSVAKYEGKDNISSKVAIYQSSLVRSEIRKIVRDLFQGLTPVINAGASDAAEAAAKAALSQDAKVLELLFANPKELADYKASLKQTARHGIQAMVDRVLNPQWPLSTRVWNSGAMASGALDRKINSALARNASAVDLAKLVEGDLLPQHVKGGKPGGTSYAAYRLARTEINNAFHAQSIGQAQDSPWVVDMEWHLSLMHKDHPGDLCESYAREQYFVKADTPPKPHPQCMCFVTPVDTGWEDFATQLKAGAFDDYYEKTYGSQVA